MGVEAKRLAASRARPPIFLESKAGLNSFDLGWEAMFEMGQARFCAALAGSLASDLPSQEQLSTIDVPALILAWRSDVQHPVETARMLHDVLPRSELYIAHRWSDIEKELPDRARTFIQKLINGGWK